MLVSFELATLERHTHEHALETLAPCPLFRPDAAGVSLLLSPYFDPAAGGIGFL